MRDGSTLRRFWRLTAAAALAAGTMAVSTAGVAAADALDQSYTASGPVVFIHDVKVAAQTYTAGRTGSLNRVDLSVGRLDDPGALTVQIEFLAAGVPSGVAIASATVAPASVPGDGVAHTVSVPLPPTLATVGTQYAIVLSAPAAPEDTAWIWPTDSSDGYAGGTAFDGDTRAGTWTVRASSDRTFGTWVDSTPCAPGSYSGTGFGPCVAADPGHFATGPGATSQAQCAVGSYQPDAGAADCIPAPIGSYVDATGATTATPCPAGTTTAATGATSAADCVSAAKPPTIECSATPSVLWPPNNKLVPVTVSVTTTGATGFSLVAVTNDEGAGNSSAGWTIGTSDVSGRLRASRSGDGDGRTYSLTYEASNAAGDTAQCVATVLVPHDQGGN